MSSGRVLIVDDDQEVRDMLTEYLASHGYEVAQADGGKTMRAELERAVPDVVLLDVGLPGEDGLTLARYLRERYELGIVMVTGPARWSTGSSGWRWAPTTTSPSRSIRGSLGRG